MILVVLIGKVGVAVSHATYCSRRRVLVLADIAGGFALFPQVVVVRMVRTAVLHALGHVGLPTVAPQGLDLLHRDATRRFATLLLLLLAVRGLLCYSLTGLLRLTLSVKHSHTLSNELELVLVREKVPSVRHALKAHPLSAAKLQTLVPSLDFFPGELRPSLAA